MVQNAETLKAIVKEKYAQIAQQDKLQNQTSCCGVGSSCDTIEYSVFAENYSELEGYNQDADLGLGCGLPTQFAQIKTGDTVVDLGSGAGNDCFVARSLTGAEGKVIGIDMTPIMIEKARENVAKLGFKNVEFRLGDIEKIPLTSNTADVVVSNCVLNLVPNKTQAFAETFRILKAGGHFSISDVVLMGELPENLKKDAQMYAGCVSGAIQKETYLETIQNTGFQNITIQKERKIELPEEILNSYFSVEEQQQFGTEKLGIYSITVYAEKPNCAPNSGCC